MTADLITVLIQWSYGIAGMEKLIILNILSCIQKHISDYMNMLCAKASFSNYSAIVYFARYYSVLV